MKHTLPIVMFSWAFGPLPAIAEEPSPPSVVSSPQSPEVLYEKAAGILKRQGGDAEARQGYGLMRQAAEQGHLPAIAGVAYLLNTGTGVGKDPVEAAIWFRQAATQGHAISQYNLAKLLLADSIPLENGTSGREKQHREALEWLQKAANQDLIQARADYGIILMRGDFGLEPDASAAARHLIPAGDAGNPEALNALGTLYQYGNGVPFDLAAAERAFRDAAMRGHVKAQANLGEFLDPLSENPERKAEALAWLFIARDGDDVVAKKLLQDKMPAVSPQDESAGNKKAAEIRRLLRSAKR